MLQIECGSCDTTRKTAVLTAWWMGAFEVSEHKKQFKFERQAERDQAEREIVAMKKQLRDMNAHTGVLVAAREAHGSVK